MATSFVGTHKIFFGLLIIVATTIVAVQAGSYYYYSRSSSDCPSQCLGSSITIDTLINYGNGTLAWINKTDVPSDWNFYQLTDSIANIQATFYGPPTSEHLVTGINGKEGNGQYFWSLWAVCKKSNAWMATSVGADAIHVTSYHTFAWYYQPTTSQDSSTWNPPIPGAPKVTTC